MENNASNQEVPPTTESQAKDSVSEVIEGLKRHFAQQAADWRERERTVTPLQQEHIDRLRAYRARLSEAAEAYFKEQASSSQAKPKGESMNLVHVKLGGELGDGQPPFIPGPDDLERARSEWQEALGDRYLVVATHYLEDIVIYEL